MDNGKGFASLIYKVNNMLDIVEILHEIDDYSLFKGLDHYKIIIKNLYLYRLFNCKEFKAYMDKMNINWLSF